MIFLFFLVHIDETDETDRQLINELVEEAIDGVLRRGRPRFRFWIKAVLEMVGVVVWLVSSAKSNSSILICAPKLGLMQSAGLQQGFGQLFVDQSSHYCHQCQGMMDL